MRSGKPSVDQAPHPAPANPAILAAARKRPVPEPAYLMTEQIQRRAVHGHSVIADMSTYNRSQPFACVLNGRVHSLAQFGFHGVQLHLQPFTNPLPYYRRVSVAPLFPADMRDAEKVERLRLSFSAPLPVSSRERPELQEPRFVGMQFQAERLKLLGGFSQKPPGIRFTLKSNHGVVRVPHDDDIAMCVFSTPRLDPEIEDVMEVNIRQQRRCTSALWRACLRKRSHSPFPARRRSAISG